MFRGTRGDVERLDLSGAKIEDVGLTIGIVGFLSECSS